MPVATLRARLGAIAATALSALAVVVLAPSAATAHTPVRTSPAAVTHPQSGRHESARARVDARVKRVIAEAKKQKGKPYSYGGAGPHAFDCSGLVMYVFEHSIGESLPHNAAAQYDAIHHISRSHLRPGDLVFVDNGSITHVGIYAGHHHWWVAPHTGTHVEWQRIYHAHLLYGRPSMLRTES